MTIKLYKQCSFGNNFILLQVFKRKITFVGLILLEFTSYTRANVREYEKNLIKKLVCEFIISRLDQVEIKNQIIELNMKSNFKNKWNQI